MNAREDMRLALEAATKAMSRAILAAKEAGQNAQVTELMAVRETWVKAANRAYHGAGPRGRIAVPPIVPASYNLKPPVRLRPPVPALRVVEVEPFSATIDRVVLEAQRAQRASRKLLRDCEQERGAPDAG